MKLNKILMAVALLGSVGTFFASAVAGQKNGVQEAIAAGNPTEQQGADQEQAAAYPDYKIGLFSHKAHVNGAKLQCTDCHSGIFQMSAGTAKAEGDFDKISFGEGKYCGACHNGSVTFAIQDEANCSRCHGNDVNPPATILFEKPVKGVQFNHALHNKELGLACNECHMRLFAMKTGSTGEKADFTMDAMYNGKYCGACHDGTLAFDLKTDCTKCHTEMPGGAGADAGSGEEKATEQ